MGNEKMTARALLDRLSAKYARRRDEARKRVAAWADDLKEAAIDAQRGSPLYMMKWSGSAFAYAAEVTAYSIMAEYTSVTDESVFTDSYSPEDAVREFYSYIRGRVLQGAASPPRSSSPWSNLAEQEEVRVFAKEAREIVWLLEQAGIKV